LGAEAAKNALMLPLSLLRIEFPKIHKQDFVHLQPKLQGAEEKARNKEDSE